MIITRAVRPDREFAILSNKLLRDTSLTFRARGVLCFILSHADGWNVSSENLSTMGVEGRDAIRTCLAELEAAGYLVRTRTQDEKGHWSTVAKVSDEPMTDSQASGIQATDSQALKEDQPKNTKNNKERGAAQKVVFDRSTFDYVGISDEQRAAWATAHPSINVETEIVRSACWLAANPSGEKRNYLRFISNWLSRASDRANNRVTISGAISADNRSARDKHRAEWGAAHKASMDRLRGQEAAQQSGGDLFDEKGNFINE